jgi:porin
MNEKRIQGGALVLDPRNIPTVSGLDDLFSNGVSLVGLWKFFHDVGGLPGSNLFLGSWANGDFIAFDHPWIVEPDIPAVVPAEESGTWSVAYVLEQQLWADRCNKKRNVGLLSEWGYADPATNLYEWVANVSLQANGLVPGREADRMGAGWFYNGVSSDLKSLAAPFLEVNDLTGVEMYYNAEVTPWFHLTTDVQVVEPSFRDFGSTAFVLGMRGKISL